MGSSKETMKKVILFSIVAVIIIFVVVVIAVLIGIIFLLSGEDGGSSLGNTVSNNVSNSGTGTTTSTSPIPPTEDLWASITLPSVEKNCLSAAKVQAGDLAWAVSSCSCLETKTLGEKNYSCVVSAIDGPHDLGLDCIKEQGNCVITSEQGTFTFTFQELYQLAS